MTHPKQQMAKPGLCLNLPYSKISWFFPTIKDHIGYKTNSYWAMDNKDKGTCRRYCHLNTFRQTIVLFCAAMNGEL